MTNFVAMKLSGNSVRDHEAVIFSCFMPGENLQEHRLANHSLVFVCEGEIDIIDNNRNLTVGKGEYVFLQRDCQIRIHKHSAGEIPGKGQFHCQETAEGMKKDCQDRDLD